MTIGLHFWYGDDDIDDNNDDDDIIKKNNNSRYKYIWLIIRYEMGKLLSYSPTLCFFVNKQNR